MTGDWDFYFLHVDDKPASIYVNLALAANAPIIGQGHMAYIRIVMRQPRADGLSSQEEYDDLIDLEDAVTEHLAQQGHTYAGRNTSDGNRDFYFYTADPLAFQESAFAAMTHHRHYRFQVGGRPDPDWEVYRKFLYPSADDLQRILNRRVLKQLAENGDDHSKSRAIDHFAYLPNASSAARLREFLISQGFAFDEPRIEGGSVVLTFKRSDAPENIDEVVLPVARRIEELGGEYDGWGCEVVI